MESACSSRSRPAHHPNQQQEMYSVERRRSFYVCTFCRRDFASAQALGGHMNVHRRDRARLLLLTSSTSSSSSRHLTPTPPPSPPRSDSPLDDDDHGQHHHRRPTTLFVCRQLTTSSSSSSRSPARNPINGKEDVGHVVSLELGIGCKEDPIAAKPVLDLELRLGCFTTI